MNKFHQIVRVIVTAAALSFTLSACNTIQGAGKDIERGGEKVQDAAEKAKHKH